MLKVILEIWGGGWFLLNKFALSASEKEMEEGKKRKWVIRAWTAYLLGLVAWETIFVIEHNWIVLFVEGIGVISVSLALYNAVTRGKKELTWLTSASKIAVVMGIVVSVMDFGGFATLKQLMELGSTVGFLVGTHLLAKKRSSGYLWYLLMNGSMGALVAFEGYWFLAIQQAVSLVLVVDAYRGSLKNEERS